MQVRENESCYQEMSPAPPKCYARDKDPNDAWSNDDDLLHSTHRSRFFKLLDKFLASSHLPAALVASFIKRLSRLALQAPPGAIVWIIPWTYNMLRAHRSCTFMLHRPHHLAHAIYANNPNYREDGLVDPFSMNEMDPMGDGTYEMVVHRDASRSWVSHLSQAYPDLEVWRTNDLFVQSPHDANLWRFAGRRDDVIVLTTRASDRRER